MLCTCRAVTGPVLWANLHLLFWLSLIPFATGRMGENSFAPAATVLYGAVLLLAAVAYMLSQQSIIASQGSESLLKQAIGSDWNGKVSPLLYALAIGVAYWGRWVSLCLYVLVAMLWLIPDRRIGKVVQVHQRRSITADHP